MVDEKIPRPHMVTWKQDRQELRNEWARMTMAGRLAASAALTRDTFSLFGRGDDGARAAFTVSRVAFRKR